MRILFSGEHVLDNAMHGISRMSRRVLSGLMDRGHECVVFGEYSEHPFDKRLQNTTNINDGDVLLLPANGLVGVPDEQHDIIMDCELPIVSIIYDIIPYIFNKNKEERYVQAIKKTLDISRNIITISHHSARDIKTHLSYDKDITVIHPGVPFDPPVYQPIEPDEYFLSVGGYGERKGHTELLQAIPETNQPLVMVGTRFYYDKKTEDLARKAIGRGLVVTLQGVPDAELINLYQYAKALIYPTKYEGFGLPVIEAMSCGCPVITTASTGTLEAAGEAALFIEPTTDGIIWGMKHVQNCREELIHKGLRHSSTFSWEKIAADYEKALDK